MKKKIVQFVAMTLAVLLCFPTVASAASPRTMRIGLYYGSNALVTANLQNKDNVGYRLGYFDDAMQFVSVAYTDKTKISMLKTQNVYLASDGSYTTTAGNNGVVGCYHIQLPETYTDFQEAEVAALAVGGFTALIQGVYSVRVGAYPDVQTANTALEALGNPDAKVLGTSAFGISIVETGTTKILFQFDSGIEGERGALGIMPGILDDTKAVTHFKGRSYHGGFRYERIAGGNLTVVNILEMEEYIKGVIPYEMSASWPLEALKAQAVCARTYAAGGQRHKSQHFDLCNTTDCQVYYGTGSANDNSNLAVDSTAGLHAYYNNKLISAVYFSCDGGATEDVKNVWGTDYGYLIGKADPYEADVAAKIPGYYWTKTYTAETLKARLHEKNYLCSDIVSFNVSKFSKMGNAIEIKIVDTTGKTYTFSRDKIRSILGITSIRFQVATTGASTGSTTGGYFVAGTDKPVESLAGLYSIGGDNTVGSIDASPYVVTDSGKSPLTPTITGGTAASGVTYTITGTGKGHNVGMSQWGAFAMAKRGSTYEDILHFFYTDIEIK